MRTAFEAPPNTPEFKARYELARELQRVVGGLFKLKYDPNSFVASDLEDQGDEAKSQGHQFHLSFRSEGSDNELVDCWADDRRGDVTEQLAKGLDKISREVRKAAKALRARARKGGTSNG
jgi:hypothetical protein